MAARRRNPNDLRSQYTIACDRVLEFIVNDCNVINGWNRINQKIMINNYDQFFQQAITNIGQNFNCDSTQDCDNKILSLEAFRTNIHTCIELRQDYSSDPQIINQLRRDYLATGWNFEDVQRSHDFYVYKISQLLNPLNDKIKELYESKIQFIQRDLQQKLDESIGEQKDKDIKINSLEQEFNIEKSRIQTGLNRKLKIYQQFCTKVIDKCINQDEKNVFNRISKTLERSETLAENISLENLMENAELEEKIEVEIAKQAKFKKENEELQSVILIDRFVKKIISPDDYNPKLDFNSKKNKFIGYRDQVKKITFQTKKILSIFNEIIKFFKEPQINNFERINKSIDEYIDQHAQHFNSWNKLMGSFLELAMNEYITDEAEFMKLDIAGQLRLILDKITNNPTSQNLKNKLLSIHNHIADFYETKKGITPDTINNEIESYRNELNLLMEEKYKSILEKLKNIFNEITSMNLSNLDILNVINSKSNNVDKLKEIKSKIDTYLINHNNLSIVYRNTALCLNASYDKIKNLIGIIECLKKEELLIKEKANNLRQIVNFRNICFIDRKRKGPILGHIDRLIECFEKNKGNININLPEYRDFKEKITEFRNLTYNPNLEYSYILKFLNTMNKTFLDFVEKLKMPDKDNNPVLLAINKIISGIMFNQLKTSNFINDIEKAKPGMERAKRIIEQMETDIQNTANEALNNYNC